MQVSGSYSKEVFFIKMKKTATSMDFTLLVYHVTVVSCTAVTVLSYREMYAYESGMFYQYNDSCTLCKFNFPAFYSRLVLVLLL
jgi:hypothetical protein